MEKENITHSELCVIGGKWLKKHKLNAIVSNCSIVAVELFTQSESEIPDIIGWSSWCSIMIEVKVQRNDFLIDCKKSFRINPILGAGEFRYYLCPEDLISKDEIPENWGLLYFCNKSIKIIKRAKRQISNLQSERNMLTSYIRKNDLKLNDKK